MYECEEGYSLVFAPHTPDVFSSLQEETSDFMRVTHFFYVCNNLFLLSLGMHNVTEMISVLADNNIKKFAIGFCSLIWGTNFNLEVSITFKRGTFLSYALHTLSVVCVVAVHNSQKDMKLVFPLKIHFHIMYM